MDRTLENPASTEVPQDWRGRCRDLEAELEYTSGVMDVLRYILDHSLTTTNNGRYVTPFRNDLQIKDEQFEFLYSSLRAQTRQTADSRELDNSLLRNRIDFLESSICSLDRENVRLRAKLQEVELKLSQVTRQQTPPLSQFSLSRVPEDVIGHILEYCNTRELGMVSCTDQHLRQFASMDRLWKAHYMYSWGKWELCMEEKKVTGKATIKNSWKTRFGEKQVMENNWRRQRFNVTNLVAHSGTVTCIHLGGSRMFSGSDDGSLICWEIDEKSGEVFDSNNQKLVPPPALPLAQLVDAISNPSCVQISGEQSFHLNLHPKKGYKKRHCSKTRTFHGHGGPVWCLDYDDRSDVLYSGSYDQTIKVWDVKTQACRRTLRGHTGWVSSVALLKHAYQGSGSETTMLASTSWDSTIRLWRVSEPTGEDFGADGEFLDQGYQAMNAGVGNALYCISISPSGGIINVGCRNREIQQWDLERSACVGTLLGHAKEVHALDTAGSVIVSGSGDGTAKLWDGQTYTCSMTLRGHTDSVMTVQVFCSEYTLLPQFFICLISSSV